MSAYTHSGKVYFAACGDFVKIGYTAGPIGNRLYHLGVEVRSERRRLRCPDDLDRTRPVRLIATIPDCVMRDEKRVHSLFAAHRVFGEWFRVTEAFVDHMLGLEYVTYKQNLLDFRRARADLKRRPSLGAAA